MIRSSDPMRPTTHGTILPAGAPIAPFEIHLRRKVRNRLLIAGAGIASVVMLGVVVG